MASIDANLVVDVRLTGLPPSAPFQVAYFMNGDARGAQGQTATSRGTFHLPLFAEDFNPDHAPGRLTVNVSRQGSPVRGSRVRPGRGGHSVRPSRSTISCPGLRR